MSRIYEALQRAETERKNATNPDGLEPLDRMVSTTVCDPLPIQNVIDLDSLPRQRWVPDLAALPTLAGHGAAVEQFRSLRSRLHVHRLQQDMKTILVSSGLPAEGKTFVALNLVMSLAQNGEGQVLLVDADLRRPTSHKVLGAASSPGLAEYLEGKACLQEIIQRGAPPISADSEHCDYSNVAFIPAGRCTGSALEQISSHRIDELISQLSLLFDWIILDSPPVLVVSDAEDLARAADAVLLVARAEATPYTVAQSTKRTFTNSRLLGFVLNASKDVKGKNNYYPYYHDASDSAASAKKTLSKESRK